MSFFDLFRRKKEELPKPQPAKQQPTVMLPDGKMVTQRLATYLSKLESIALPCIRIDAKPATDLFLFDSKFGGDPYWPADRPYPTDGEGKPMYLLAQLNFSQIPRLEGFPENGLLQFYASADSMYGLNLDRPTDQTSFRVIYFDNTEAPALDHFHFLHEEGRRDALPLERPMQLSFTPDKDYYSFSNFRLPEERMDELLGDLPGDEEFRLMEEEMAKVYPDNGHKIGGYAYFTQYDPRDDKAYDDYILLLQIDSQLPDICWGDVGVGNFFIDPEDLKRKDFSRVLYNWDCT